MISIRKSIGADELKEIETKHWQWFKENKLKNLINRIKLDEKLLRVFFTDKNEFNTWYDKNSCESTQMWLNRQSKDKLERFRPFIIGNKSEMKNLINKLGVMLKLKKDELKANPNGNSVHKYLEGIYSDFRSENEGWSGTQLIKDLGIRVCSYCNRSFIDIYKVDRNKKIKSNSQLDHYYSKDKYPYLALNLYNLIPSCSSCNFIKLNRDDEVVYPYEEEFGDDGVFVATHYDSEDVDKEKYDIEYLYGRSDNFKIKIDINYDSELRDAIRSSVEVFKIEDLYNNHKEHVKELMLKSIMYGPEMINELYSQYGSLFSSKDDLIQTIFSVYIDERRLGERPLAKLNSDLLRCSLVK